MVQFPGGMLWIVYYAQCTESILYISETQEECFHVVLFFTLERHQEWRKYCNRQKIRLQFLYDFWFYITPTV